LKVFSHDSLSKCDLIVDALYEGGTIGNFVDDAISKILPGTGNQGGFRPAGRGEKKRYVALFTSGQDQDWPDSLDTSTGRFTYWGDNKKPGHELHDTVRGGNKLLRSVFGYLHEPEPRRLEIPPFFIFLRNPTTHSNWTVRFLGLAIPGSPGTPSSDDLVAVWRSSEGHRFLNYRALFTIVDSPLISRQWISDLCDGRDNSKSAPDAWKRWVSTGTYLPLTPVPTSEIRSMDEQLPGDDYRRDLLHSVYAHFRENPIGFERFAARVFQYHDRRVVVDEITRPVRDGGRDAVGRYRLGVEADPVHVDFALEAKCYNPGIAGGRPSLLGVKEVARLIARLRHRQFGVIVTTSAVGRQAYSEIRDDGHPVVIIAGGDVVDILLKAGIKTRQQVASWLANDF